MDWLTEIVSAHGLWLGLMAVFAGGVALNLTPCVYPMLPVTVAFFSGQAAGSAGRAASLAASYVLGISLTYALLGLLAAQTGAFLGSWLQHPAVLATIGLVLVALALSMFGLYELRVPTALASRVGQAPAGYGGAFLMGVVVGVVAAPCIGPFVLGLLLFVGQLADPLAGFLLFFALGAGMGLPYLLIGIAANRLMSLAKAGPWLLWVKRALGLILLGLALYFLRSLLPPFVVQWAAVGLCLGAGVYLGWVDRASHPRAWFLWTRRLVGAGLLVAAFVLTWPKPAPGPTVAWAPYSEAAFAQAACAQRPILIDVYADWCLPCVEMDHVTFRHPDVVAVLGSVTTLRVDATRGLSAEAEALLERHQVYGAPTVLLFDRSGQERRDLRLTGFAPPDDFLQRLRRLL